MTTHPPADPPRDDLPTADLDPDDALREAELEAQALQCDPEILRTLGPPLSRRSPYMIGLLGAAGVVTTLAVARIVIDISSVLLLIGLSLFLAIGMEPAV